jgi:Xaa-Pro aminopeptidase
MRLPAWRGEERAMEHSRDPERIDRIRRSLAAFGLDALACARPSNVLMLSGYWPVVGTAVALATADGRVAVVAPKDEEDLARESAADVYPFEPGSLHELRSVREAIRGPLADAARALGIGRGRVGHDAGAAFEPSPYAALHSYGRDLPALLAGALPGIAGIDAIGVLRSLRAVLTSSELSRVREACALAAGAFAEGAAGMHVGMTEAEAAAVFRPPLSAGDPGLLDRTRADGFVYCMSGPNAYHASAAYQRSRGRRLERGDLALVHCNSYVGGYWTDITRTYTLGEPDDRARRMYDAVFDARSAALAAVRPGARGRDVDRAARDVIRRHGFGDDAFPHGTGHGVGFAAIDHTARPRLHPASDDVLEPGMAFNVEPAIYVERYGGLRHCDMVVVTPTGAEVLTPFQSAPGELRLEGAGEGRGAVNTAPATNRTP